MSRKRNNQDGLVSFMITMILTLVITLVVMGFTQVANRNRREALDRQLSTQAFYAAESGVNNAVGIINNRLAAGQPVQAQDDCDAGPYVANPVLSTSPLVEYTCVFVSPTVPDLESSPTTTSSVVIPLDLTDKVGGALPLSSSVDIEFTWSVAAGANPNPGVCPLPGNFPQNNPANECGYGLLRVDLMQMNAFNSAVSAANNTKTFFMQPVSSTPGNVVSISNFGDPKGHIIPATCTAATQTCNAVIRVSGSAKAPLIYTARISTLYRDAPRLVVDGRTASGENAWFNNAQASIDVTGKAQDVLRRVKVRVPLHDMGGNNVPLGGVNSTATVCKRFTVSPTMYHSECD